MKALLLFAILLVGVGRCDRDNNKEAAPLCLIDAKVLDLTGKLDGCGVVLELADGKRLIPERRQYVQAPKQEDDPLYYFELKDGDKLKIAYNETNSPNVCMVGRTVFITCITKAE